MAVRYLRLVLLMLFAGLWRQAYAVSKGSSQTFMETKLKRLGTIIKTIPRIHRGICAHECANLDDCEGYQETKREGKDVCLILKEINRAEFGSETIKVKVTLKKGHCSCKDKKSKCIGGMDEYSEANGECSHTCVYNYSPVCPKVYASNEMKTNTCIACSSVALDTNITTPHTPVTFNKLLVHGQWDQSKNEFRVPSDGFYLISLSVGNLPGTTVNCNVVRNGDPLVNLTQTYTASGQVEVLSREAIVELVQGDVLQVHSLSKGLYSDDKLLISFSVLSISHLVGPNPVIILLSGMTTKYVAKDTGVYFMCMSFLWKAVTEASEYIEIHDVMQQGLLRHAGPAETTGTGTANRCFLLEVGLQYPVELKIYSGSPYNVALSGFMYSPVSTQPVAWSIVVKITECKASETLSFLKVRVDRGGAVLQTENTIAIPVSGLYFVHLSGGNYGKMALDYTLVLNGACPLIGLTRTPAGHFNTLSRSAILAFKSGDRLTLRCGQDSDVLSGWFEETSLLGFLIQPGE